MTLHFHHLICSLLAAVASTFGLGVCIFVALFVAYAIWATAAASGTGAK